MYGTNDDYGQYRVYARDHELLGDTISGYIFSKVKDEATEWLWPGRVPLGAITLLDGDPGLGKSLITIDLAARVSTGREMPDGTDGAWAYYCREAILLSAEDHPARTIRPRLCAAGADLDCIIGLDEVESRDPATGQVTSHPFELPQDISELERMISRDTSLVVIDPLMAYLGRGVNSWRDQDVRNALAPLTELAHRTQIAVVILRHLNKASGMSALYRGGGSIGIIGAVRSGLLVAKSPDDPDHERILAATKSNLGPPMPSLRYRIAATQPNDGSDGVPYIEWLGESKLSAEQLVSAPPTEQAEPSPSKVEEAMQWLTNKLAGVPRLGRIMESEATAAGISDATLRRARAKLGVVIEQRGYGAEKFTIWRMDAHEAQEGSAAGDEIGETGAEG